MIRKTPSGTIALERLKSLLNEEKTIIDEDTMTAIRRDIGNVVLKYVDIEPDNVDIKIILKEYKKKIPC